MDGDAGGGGIQSGADEEPDGGGCVRRGEKGRKAPRNGPTGPEPGRVKTARAGFQGAKTASEELKQRFRGQISAACSWRLNGYRRPKEFQGYLIWAFFSDLLVFLQRTVIKLSFDSTKLQAVRQVKTALPAHTHGKEI